jgi:hypothetical protein
MALHIDLPNRAVVLQLEEQKEPFKVQRTSAPKRTSPAQIRERTDASAVFKNVGQLLLSCYGPIANQNISAS